MIDDIIYEAADFILEIDTDSPDGVINGFSLDGGSFDFTVETSSVFVT